MMKKLMCLFCAALLLAVSQTWAEAKPPVKDYATGAWSEEYGAMSTGSLFIPAKDDETIDWDTLSPSISTASGEFEHIRNRARWISESLGCDVVFFFLENFASMQEWKGFPCGSMEEVLEQCMTTWRFKLTENSIWIVYSEQEDELFLHVGENIAPECDLSGVESALRNKNEPDHYFRGLDAISALCDAIRQSLPDWNLTFISGREPEAISLALKPLREKFSGYVYVECNMTPESIRKMAEPLNYDRFYADAIYICYKQQTGEAFVRVGERTGLTLKDAAAVEAAFQPGEDSEDSSGFAAGIISLSNALTDDAGVSPVLVVSVIAIVLAAAGVLTLILVRRKKSQEL